MNKPKEPETLSNQLNLFPDARPGVVDMVLKIEELYLSTVGAEPGGDLVESVENYGILLPIIVQRQGKKYKVIDGIRRTRAAIKVGMKEIPARAIPEDSYHTEGITITTNLARRANPVVEFKAIRSLVEKGFTESFIQKELGVKSAIMKQRLLLNNLDEILLGLLESGKIPVGVGEAAAKLPRRLQKDLIKVFEAEERIRLADVRRISQAKQDEAADELESMLFSKDELNKEREVKLAKGHIQAAEELLRKHGFEIDFGDILSKIK